VNKIAVADVPDSDCYELGLASAFVVAAAAENETGAC